MDRMGTCGWTDTETSFIRLTVRSQKKTKKTMETMGCETQAKYSEHSPTPFTIQTPN